MLMWYKKTIGFVILIVIIFILFSLFCSRYYKKYFLISIPELKG